MKKNNDSFFRAFFLGSGSLIAFVLGLIAIGILSNAAYDLFIDTPSILRHGWKIVIAFLALMAIAYLLFKWDIKRHTKINFTVDDSQLAPASKGIIWILGPNVDPLPFVLQHHRKGQGGTHCWLIMQKDQVIIEETFVTAKDIFLQNNWIDLSVQQYYLKSLTAHNAYNAVNTILTREAQEAGLNAEQIICDITGGLKPLTAGMMLAAIVSNCKVEYVETQRDDKGRPIEGTQRVVLVDTKFYLTRENTI